MSFGLVKLLRHTFICTKECPSKRHVPHANSANLCFSFLNTKNQNYQNKNKQVKGRDRKFFTLAVSNPWKELSQIICIRLWHGKICLQSAKKNTIQNKIAAIAGEGNIICWRNVVAAEKIWYLNANCSCGSERGNKRDGERKKWMNREWRRLQGCRSEKLLRERGEGEELKRRKFNRQVRYAVVAERHLV